MLVIANRLRINTKRSFLLVSIAVLLWMFMAVEPSGIFVRSRAFAKISECDKIAVDKGSLLTDNEACANPCTSTVTSIASTPSEPGPVFILGDSIGQGLTTPLDTALKKSSPTAWSVSGDTRVGRPLSEGLSVAQSKPAGMTSAKYILVVLGTNNLGDTSSNQQNISDLMTVLKTTSAKIYWLKVNVTRSDLAPLMGPYNELLQASGANVIDNTVTPGSDGVHPSNYDQLANSVAQSIASSAPTDTSGGESLQSLATQMLNNQNISYWTNNGVNTRDVVVAMSQGKKAYTTASNATNKEADLNPNILKFILEVAQKDKIMVNALTDKTHSNGSNHYKGLAVDIDNNGSNSPPTSVLDPIAAKYGGTRNSETTHWHYDFTGSASADASSASQQTQTQTASCCQTTSNQPTTTSTGAKDLQDFVDKYGQLAFNTGKKYGIPYEAIIAQAAVESGKGNSQLTREANNFFGIKAGSSWHGPVWTGQTGEQTQSGQSYTVTASFRSYPTPQAGFDGYGEFITTNSRYKNALNYPGDPVQYITEIKNAGYATDTQYVQTLSRVIEQVTNYIKQKGTWPPSSEVKPDATPPSSTGGNSGSDYVDCNGLISQQQSAGDGSVESNKQIAKNLLAQKGLPDSEWQCLDKLWTRESGWRQDAKNPSSGAYGIPQSLPGDKMQSAGADWQTNPLTQITWGLGYIEQRYQTPCGAWAHSEQTGWY